MTERPVLVFIVGLIASIISTSAALGDPPFFMGLGDLMGGAQSSAGYAVTPDGAYVVGRSISASGGEAFRWTQVGGMVGLGDLSGGQFSSYALDISADGTVVVGQGSNQTTNSSAVRWVNGVPSDLGALSLNGLSTAWGVSADGAVVVGEADSPDGHVAFRWTAGDGMVPLGFLPGLPDGTSIPSSVSYAISSDGVTVVGASTSSSGWEAFKWQNNVMVGLGFVGEGRYSEARDVSADGSVIVGASNTTVNGGTQAFRWANGLMTGLGGIPGEPVGSSAQAVSGDGSIVVGAAGSSDPGGNTAFIWDASHGMRSVKDMLLDDYGISLSGWYLGEVRDISADGNTLVGHGWNPQGFSEGWIAHIPEPTTLILISIGCCFVRRRQRA